MPNLTVDQMEKFVFQEVKNNNTNESCLTRFLHKKYKCIIIWMISIISMSQFLYLLLQNNYDEILIKLLEIAFNSTKEN